MSATPATAPAARIESPLVPALAGDLPAGTRVGTVHLAVTDLERSLAFYCDLLGLPAGPRTAASPGGPGGRARSATAAAGDVGPGHEPALVLYEEPRARPAGRHAGLYHVALLYPSRLELARVAQRLGAASTPIEGASDHGTHEAIYLPDPDGNGVELAADTPPAGWPSYAEEFARSGPRPLDQRSLFGLVAGERPVPGPVDGISVGHLHLHVGDIAAAEAFYNGIVGFDVMARISSAGFVAAGGYHHHLAFNVWRGQGVPPQPEGAVGLRHWTLVLPDAAALAGLRARAGAAGVHVEEAEGAGARPALLLRDPAGNALVAVTEG